MPCEILKIHLKPVNFFDKNPALDVPPSEQSFNKSVLISNAEQHHQPSVEARAGKDGTCCAPEGGAPGARAKLQQLKI